MSGRKSATPRRKKRGGIPGGKITLPGLVLAVLLLILAAAYENGWLEGLYPAEEGQETILPAEGTGLTLHMVDVGQGLGMLLQCGEESAVFDTGTPAAAEDFAEYVSVHAPEGVEYVFISHPHQDHCGGAKTLFSTVEAKTLVAPDCGEREAALMQAGEWLGASSAGIDFTEAGREYTLGDATITVLHPDSEFESDDYNHWSLVLRVEYAGVSVLLTGDQEQKVEKSLIPMERVNILQVGHHGSSTSSCQAFLENIAPDVALVSVGAGNSYGHPHQKTMQRLRETGADIYRTDENGTVVVTVSPSGSISVTPEK